MTRAEDVEKLAAWHDAAAVETDDGDQQTAAMLRALLAERDAARAEAQAMREALAPLASMAPHFPQTQQYGNRPTYGTIYQVSSHGKPDGEITVEDLHRAAALLARGGERG